MCGAAMRIHQAAFFFITDCFKTQGMCYTVVCMEPYLLPLVPDRFKTGKMSDKTVRKEHLSLLYVPDWFVTQQQVKYLRDDNNDWHDNKLID